MKSETVISLSEARAQVQGQRSGTASAAPVESTWTAVAYHELADVPVKEINLLDAVDENLQRLDELQARLSFMIREVKYLMKL